MKGTTGLGGSFILAAMVCIVAAFWLTFSWKIGLFALGVCLFFIGYALAQTEDQ